MSLNKIADNSETKHLSTYGLALFLILTPFEYPLADLMATSPLRIVGLFAMGLAVLDIIFQKHLIFDYRIICMSLWLIYGYLSSFWTVDTIRFESYYSIYINNAIMFILFSMIAYTKKEVEMLKKSMVFGVAALLIYITFVPGAVVYSSGQNRLTIDAGSEGLDQNYLAALTLIAFGIIFYNLCNSKQKIFHKFLSLVFCLTVAYYVLLTGSRSGLFALILIVLLCINTSWKTRLTIGIPLIIVLFIAFPIILKSLPTDIAERLSISAITGQEAESETRLIIWEKAFASLHGVGAIFGYGAGASQTIVGNVLGRGDAAIHNHYIAMVVEFGVFGSFFVNMPIFMMLKSMAKKEKSMVIAFAGILMMAFFLDVVTTKFFWSAMILLTVCCSAYKSSEGSEQVE